jgi:EAL domain-containing protein (putative c-di-GMP-specific phosphodiesterase class I)
MRPSSSLADTGLADRFAALAGRHGTSPRRIVCGIGERALRRDAAGLAALTRLRLKGFGVSLEGFGATNVSPEQLSRLPLTGVKVAGSLVSGAAADQRRVAALEQALDLARGLGLVVTAAGCDSASDFDLLLQLGCRHAEGEFVAGPMEAGDLIAWAGRWSPA